MAKFRRAIIARIRRVPPDSDNRISKFMTFGSRFELPTNSNAQRWRIPTNVHVRMKNLNPENDL
jgi:hypothetical protein